jgi:two-component system LytT family response regulator
LIRALITDDEPLARDVLRIRLAEEPGIEVVGEAATGAETITRVATLLPDLLLLDIAMPDMSGFEVLRRLSVPDPPAVVFVTAFDQHAIRAFEANAIDYLLKPFTTARLRQMLARVRERLAARDAREDQRRLRGFLRSLESTSGSVTPVDPLRPRHPGIQWLSVRDGERFVLLDPAEIRWLEAAGNYVRLHHRGGIHQVRATLASFEERLDPAEFVRVHRAAIVNRRDVKEIRPTWHGDYTVVLSDGATVRLSRSYRSRVLGR